MADQGAGQVGRTEGGEEGEEGDDFFSGVH